jgi:hypothetical protein
VRGVCGWIGVCSCVSGGPKGGMRWGVGWGVLCLIVLCVCLCVRTHVHTFVPLWMYVRKSVCEEGGEYVWACVGETAHAWAHHFHTDIEHCSAGHVADRTSTTLVFHKTPSQL